MIELYCDGERVPIWAYVRVVIEELPKQALNLTLNGRKR